MYSIREHFEYLVNTYHASLYRLLYGYCRNTQDAEDCIQTAYMRLWQSDKSFKSEEHAKNWLYKTAVNYARDLYRLKWSKTEPLPEDLTFDTEESMNLYEELSELREEYRIVLLLYYYEGYSVKEISKMIDVKESTVTTRLARARGQLKVRLEEDYGS